MKVLGISCYYHDAAATLVHDGKLVAASLEERFTRCKHDSSYPKKAINFCLQYGKISSQDLDYVVFYEKPFLKFERIYQSILSSTPKSFSLFRNATISAFGEKLWIRSTIVNNLDIDKKKILFLPHHLSHAASSFLCSPFTKSAILTIDGVGEWSTATIGYGNLSEIKILEEMRFPNSIGLLYSAFTAFLGFEVNEGEYKVMGLSGFGQPSYMDKIYKIINLADDGSFTIDLSYFSYHYHHQKSFNNKFVSLFGSPRQPESYFGPKDPDFQRYADIASSIQKVTEEIVVKMAKYTKKKTGMNNLCLAGGVALNGLVNYKIAKEKIFNNIYIQPASGDAGGALGAALYVDYYFGRQKKFVMDNVYYGENYNEDEIERFIKKNKIKTMKLNNNEKIYNFIVEQLIKGKVIGWFDGRFEWGPRALGNRSILADPRNPNMRQIINQKIKFRESFRPFAPSVLVEEANKYFDLTPIALDFLSKPNPLDFMLYVTEVKNDNRQVIPAVTHVDGTSRPQIVRKKVNKRYFQLIDNFRQATGIPMLLNTSFNLSTEPIVASPEDAYSTFLKSGLDILVLGNYVIKK